MARNDGKLAIVNLTAPGTPRVVTVGTQALTSVTWSRDGRLLLVASVNGMATVLDVARLQVLTTFVGSEESLTSASFNVSATSIALTGDGTGVRVYRCDLCGSANRLLATARSIAARQLTQAERRQYLHEGGS